MTTAATMTQTTEDLSFHPMLINGRTWKTSQTVDVENPAKGQIFAEVAQADDEAVQAALQAAKEGFAAWSQTPFAERRAIILAYADLLERDRERLVGLLIEETGKPADNAGYDFGMLTTCLRYFVDEMERLDQPVLHDADDRFQHQLLRQPLGVVVGLLAWNFPLLNLGYKLGPLLAAGCSAILKPSPLTPIASLEAVYLLKEAGMPDGVVNMLTGDQNETFRPLLESDVPAMVTMIGSTQGGIQVMKTASTSIKHFSLELGGNAPVLVYADADVKAAAEKIVDLKYANTGQVCVSPNRCFVHASVYADFLEHAVARAKQVQMGPMISERERQKVLDLVAQSVKEGAELVLGGRAVEGEGYHLEPTILKGVTPGMTIARSEIFGPVLPVLSFSDEDNEIALANDTPYGLAAYVFTASMEKGMRAAREIEAGSVCINEPHYAVHLPHGGLKQSGVGKDCSKYSLMEYLTLKRVSICLD